MGDENPSRAIVISPSMVRFRLATMSQFWVSFQVLSRKGVEANEAGAENVFAAPPLTSYVLCNEWNNGEIDLTIFPPTLAENERKTRNGKASE